tara:strand:- start:7 stop:249 length:243 start_codon:yes stop_codon:yes gene_type:complete
MNNSSTQIEKDILFLQDQCDMTNRQCDEIINACEDLGGISAEYFCEEFVFVCEDEDGNEDLDALNRVHDDNYLTINWGLS